MSIVKRSWPDLQSRQMTEEAKAQLAALEAMSDEEAEARAASDPDAMPTDEAFWEGAKIIRPKPCPDGRDDCPEGMDWR